MLTAIVCLAQLVALKMNPGRSSVTLIIRTCNGTPPRMVGSGSAGADALALAASTISGDRTTTVPRSNGPALAGTTMLSENGAPLYGPAR